MLPIIMDIQNEDDRSFVESLYCHYEKKLYYIAKGILNNHFDAEDCVNDTIVLIIKHLERFKNADEDGVKRLLTVCCRNAAYRIYNANKKRRASSLDRSENDTDQGSVCLDVIDENAFIDKIIINEENARLVRRLVNKLDDSYRDVIVMKYYLNMTYTEMADIVGISETLVRVRVVRAKKKLLILGSEQLYDAR